MATAAKRTLSRSDLNELVDRAIEENGSVIIRRPGRKDLAIIPAEKLREMDTTNYLLASPANRRRLLSALRDSRAGKGKPMTIRELRKRVGLDK